MSDLEKRFPRYAKLLKLYPKPYREQYEEQMKQTLADMLDDPSRSSASVWLRTVIDLPISLTRQQLLYVGGIMTRETPRYIKRNALVSGALLLPFLAALVANTLDKVINRHELYNSWLWRMPALGIWVLWLPVLATLIALSSLAVFSLQQARAERTSWIKGTLGVRHTWPLLAVSLAGLFVVALVFGHDSVHCITGNPVHEIQNWHQTWRCVQQR